MMTTSVLNSFFAAIAGGLLTAAISWWTLQKSRSLNRARFLYDLHRDFFVDDTYKSILGKIDGASAIVGLVADEDSKLIELLNAFELVAYFVKIKELRQEDAEALLGYYLDCFQRHPKLMEYINLDDKSFEMLSGFFHKRKRQHGV